MANEDNNIPVAEINNLRLNGSISNPDSSVLVSHYKEKLSSSMKVLRMFNKELSHIKKKNEENEIENTRLKLRIQHLEKILADHVADFKDVMTDKDDKRDMCKTASISSTSSSEIPEKSDTLVEKVDNLYNDCMNQDQNGSLSAISLPLNSPATNNSYSNPFIFQNEISANPVKNRKAKKAFTKKKIIHSEKPLSNQQNPPKSDSFHFHEVKNEPQSPCKFKPNETSANFTNTSITELPESSITSIILKEEKDIQLDELPVNVRTPLKNSENAILNSPSLIENSSVFSSSSGIANNKDTWISNNDSFTYVGDTVSGESDVSTDCVGFKHQKVSLSAKKNTSYVKKTLEAGCEIVVDTVSSMSSDQMQQSDAQYISVKKKSSSLSGDNAEAVISESTETGLNSRKQQKSYKKKRIFITSQTSGYQQRQISSQGDLLIEKQKSFSEGDVSTEAVVSESELSENDASAKPRKKRKRLKKRIVSNKTPFINEQINSVERLFGSEIDRSENSSCSETSTAAPNQSKCVKNSAGKKLEGKLKRREMKSNSIDLANIKSFGSKRLFPIEESDSSIQKPRRKRVKILESVTSDDIPFSLQERAIQSEIINEISPEQFISSKVNANQHTDSESNKNIKPKRKLRSHRKEGVNPNKNSDTESNRSIVPERNLKYHKKEGDVNKGPDTESNRSIVSERKLRSHKKRENVNQNSETEKNRTTTFRRKLKGHIKGEVNAYLDTNSKINMSVIPKKKLRNHKKRDTLLSIANCTRSQSKRNFSSSEETCSPKAKSLREKMQTSEICSSNSAVANQHPKRLNCHGKSSENGNRLIKKCSENMKGETHLKEILTKEDIVSLKRTKILPPLNHENSSKDHIISKEEIDAISQTTDHLKEKLSKNSLENKLEVVSFSTEESKLAEDLINSELKNTVIHSVSEKGNLKEKSLFNSNKDPNKKLAISENILSEGEGHMALKPIQIPSLCNGKISETFPNEQEFSTEGTFMSKEKKPDSKQTSLVETKRLDIESSAKENTRETSENQIHELQGSDNLEPVNTSLPCTKEVSVRNRFDIKEANLKEITSNHCFVMLKGITVPPEIEDKELTDDNHLEFLPSEDAISSLKEKTEFNVSSALATNKKTEQKTEIEQHTTKTLNDAVSSTKENYEEDLSFDSDDTPDINSDNISPESIYEDSDCDPDWLNGDDSFRKPFKFSVKENKRGISSDEDSDNVTQRTRSIRNTARKNEHLSSKESTENQKITTTSFKVKLNAPKIKKPNIKVCTKRELSLEKSINAAIKEDLTRKNEAINKWEKLFWGTNADLDSNSELIVDEENDKKFAENADLNNSAKRVSSKDRVCDLKMKDAVSVISGSCVKEDEILKNQESDNSLKIKENGAVKNCKNNMKKNNNIESSDSDFDFDTELFADEINHEALVLPKNLITNSNPKILSVEDRIFGSDSSLDNEDDMSIKEQKNNGEDNLTCHDKTLLKNDKSNSDINSDFDPELIDEIISEELQLPEHLIINDVQKDKQVEDRVGRSDSLENTELSKNLTAEEDDSICYNETKLEKNKNHTDKNDSDIIPEMTICEKNCEELQLLKNLIENHHQETLPIEDKVFGSPCSFKSILTVISKKVVVESPISHDKIECERNTFCSDSSDSYINTELVGNKQNCEELQLPQIDNEKFISDEDKVSESVGSIGNRVSEKCERVIIEEGNSTGYEKIVHKINKNCSVSSYFDINTESIRKEPNCEELNLPGSEHQQNWSEWTGNEQNCEELHLSKNDHEEFISGIDDKISESICSLETEKYEGVIIEEGNSTDNEKIVHKINKNCCVNSNSDIDTESIRQESNLPGSDHQKNVLVTDRMWKFTKENEVLSSKENDALCKAKSDLLQTQSSCSSMKNIENATSETCENISVITKQKEQVDSNSDIHAESIRKEPNCQELNLPVSDHQKKVPVTDRISKFAKENEILSSKENDAFCKAEKDLLQTLSSCNMKNIGNATSEKNYFLLSGKNNNFVEQTKEVSTDNDITVKSMKTAEKEKNYTLNNTSINIEMALIIDEADSDELMHDGKVSNLMNSWPVDAKVCNSEKKITSEGEASVSKIELKILEEQISGSCVQSMKDIISEKNYNFVEQTKEVSTDNDITVKSMETAEKEENYTLNNISINNEMALIIDEADSDELMHDGKVSNLMNSWPVDAKVCTPEKKITSDREVLVPKIELKILEEKISGSCVKNIKDGVSEKNSIFVEMAIEKDVIVKNMKNYHPNINDHYDYDANLVLEPVKAKNCEDLNEKGLNTYDSFQGQTCENKNSQADQNNYFNKPKGNLLQTNLQNDIILGVSRHPNESSALSKINRYADQVLKFNENQFCTKTLFPILHPSCVPVESLNISKVEAQTDIKTKKSTYQKPSSHKSCVASVHEKPVTAFQNSQHEGRLSISLPETSKKSFSKTVGRPSETFHGRKESQKNFKQKKRVRRKTSNEYLKHKNLKINPENPIKSILQIIDAKENFNAQLKPHTSSFVASVCFNHCLKSLVKYLMHPDKTPDMTYLIFLVIKYLHHTRKNPLENFSENQKSIFIPAAENCIVTALFEIEKKSKPSFRELIETILNVMHQFILAKNKMHIYGLASLCRVLTEICKQENNKLKPLHLCCDLLKGKHKFASILIVSVAKVWRELFWITDNLLEEEMALQISIAYGITKSVKSSVIVSMYCSLEAVSEYFDISKNESDVIKVIAVLKNQILGKSTQNSLNSWKLTSPFVIFASFETWESTKKYLLDDFIIPNLQRFSHVANEEVFDLFCNLYVDVLLLFPEHNPDELLTSFFQSSSEWEDDNFIEDCAAVALIKHFILSKRDMPLFLTTWQEKNKNKPKVKELKILFQRRLMSENGTVFSKDEIILASK